MVAHDQLRKEHPQTIALPAENHKQAKPRWENSFTSAIRTTALAMRHESPDEHSLVHGPTN